MDFDFYVSHIKSYIYGVITVLSKSLVQFWKNNPKYSYITYQNMPRIWPTPSVCPIMFFSVDFGQTRLIN